MPFRQLFKNRFYAFWKPSRTRTRLNLILILPACRSRCATGLAFSLIKCFPCIFIVGNVDDVCEYPGRPLWGFSEYIAPLSGSLENDMSSITKQPWRLVLTWTPCGR